MTYLEIKERLDELDSPFLSVNGGKLEVKEVICYKKECKSILYFHINEYCEDIKYWVQSIKIDNILGVRKIDNATYISFIKPIAECGTLEVKSFVAKRK